MIDHHPRLGKLLSRIQADTSVLKERIIHLTKAKVKIHYSIYIFRCFQGVENLFPIKKLDEVSFSTHSSTDNLHRHLLTQKKVLVHFQLFQTFNDNSEIRHEEWILYQAIQNIACNQKSANNHEVKISHKSKCSMKNQK